MVNGVASLFKRLRHQLQKVPLLAWLPLKDAPRPFSRSDKQPLPLALKHRLFKTTQALLPPVGHVEQVVDKLRDSIQQWQDYEVMPNVLVVLMEPIELADGLLSAVLNRIQEDQDGSHKFCTYRLDEWLERPEDYVGINDAVREAIATILKESHADNDSSSPVHLIVIPALERYFLRCVDGLEAIETIRQTIASHPDYFWLVGCNHWAWSYLDKVCCLSAYLDLTFTPSPLSALDLKSWLAPMEEAAELSPFPADASPDHPSQTEYSNQMEDTLDAENASTSGQELDWRSSDERKYFEAIESEAGGVAAVAEAVWQWSLHYELNDPDTSDTVAHSPSTETDPVGVVKRGDIGAPDIPSLTREDRFLLYAILLHGRLSGSHLSLSLAEPQGMVRAQLQALSRQDLITRTQHCWAVNPAYFPSLRKDLRRNNFLVD